MSDRLELAYDEMINILLNCSERKSIFVTTTFSDYREGYSDPNAALYAQNVLKDLCAISGYSRYINKITLYHNGFLIQTGNSNGAFENPQHIMEATWFDEILSNTSGQYTLRLLDNRFLLAKYLKK